MRLKYSISDIFFEYSVIFYFILWSLHVRSIRLHINPDSQFYLIFFIWRSIPQSTELTISIISLELSHARKRSTRPKKRRLIRKLGGTNEGTIYPRHFRSCEPNLLSTFKSWRAGWIVTSPPLCPRIQPQCEEFHPEEYGGKLVDESYYVNAWSNEKRYRALHLSNFIYSDNLIFWINFSVVRLIFELLRRTTSLLTCPSVWLLWIIFLDFIGEFRGTSEI